MQFSQRLAAAALHADEDTRPAIPNLASARAVAPQQQAMQGGCRAARGVLRLLTGPTGEPTTKPNMRETQHFKFLQYSCIGCNCFGSAGRARGAGETHRTPLLSRPLWSGIACIAAGSRLATTLHAGLLAQSSHLQPHSTDSAPIPFSAVLKRDLCAIQKDQPITCIVEAHGIPATPKFPGIC